MTRKYLLYISVLIFITILLNIKKKEQFLEFIHIPKNAGTTIENIANEKNIKWGRMKPSHKDYVHTNDSPNCSYWHVPPKYFSTSSHYATDKDGTFCIVRNPYERMVSEYKYRNPSSKDPKHMNDWIIQHLTPEYTEQGDFNCHFLPQYNYVYDNLGSKLCDNVLRFENLSEDFNNLTSKYNIDLKLDDDRKDNKSNNNLSIDDLNEETKYLIKTIYHNDFHL
jgi:hypothetical protein